MSAFYSSAAVFGEGIISMYPSVIKYIGSSVWMKTLIRFVVFPLLAVVFGSFQALINTWISSPLLSLQQGIVNSIHVISSFISHEYLDIGTAVSLFYLYPIFILLWHMITSKFNFYGIVLILVAFYGAYMIATSHIDDSVSTKSVSYSQKIIGVFAAIVAAFTEALIYIFVRNSDNAFTAMYRLYPLGVFFFLIFFMFNPKLSIEYYKKDARHIPILVLVNIFIAFVGYMLRFISISHLPPFLFSILSFLGIVFSFIWGVLINKETPTKGGMIGSLLIAIAITVSRFFSMS